MRSFTVALAATLFLVQPIMGAEAITGTATVIDGDTLEVHGQRIRLHGIDAPESRQVCTRLADGAKALCGQEAALKLSDRIGRAPVTCAPKDRDRYGRTVAVCMAGDGMDLNAWMVANGQAMAYRQYSQDYVLFEDAARRAGVGIWATEFTPPWDWRRQPKGDPAPSAPPSPEVSASHAGPACKKGKPCGNSCIAIEKTCHKAGH